MFLSCKELTTNCMNTLLQAASSNTPMHAGKCLLSFSSSQKYEFYFSEFTSSLVYNSKHIILLSGQDTIPLFFTTLPTRIRWHGNKTPPRLTDATILCWLMLGLSTMAMARTSPAPTPSRANSRSCNATYTPSRWTCSLNPSRWRDLMSIGLISPAQQPTSPAWGYNSTAW